jgi:sugar phosphate isomerase/epimerase
MNDFSERAQGGSRRFPLSLHHLNAFDASHAEMIRMAGEFGCDHVCLFTHVPEAAKHLYPCIQPEDVPALRAVQAASGATLCNLEVFPLDGQEDWAAFERALETGAALGATRATTHIHDAPDQETAVARFGRLCDLAAPYGISPGLEFNAFAGVKDIRTATAIVRAAARPNGSMVCDMLHLIRNGGGPEDVAAAADIIGYVQISDGPLVLPEKDWWHEAIRERALPGEGEFPLVEGMRHLRPGTVIDIEVPQTAARKAGMSARDRIARVVEATQRVLASLPDAEAAA